MDSRLARLRPGSKGSRVQGFRGSRVQSSPFKVHRSWLGLGASLLQSYDPTSKGSFKKGSKGPRVQGFKGQNNYRKLKRYRFDSNTLSVGSLATAVIIPLESSNPRRRRASLGSYTHSITIHLQSRQRPRCSGNPLPIIIPTVDPVSLFG